MQVTFLKISKVITVAFFWLLITYSLFLTRRLRINFSEFI